MQDQLKNPWRCTGLALNAPMPVDSAEGVGGLLALCPAHQPTPLLQIRQLANRFGVSLVTLKDERARMGLGSFKALGAAHAIAREAATTGQDDLHTALTGRTFVTASAGNHGLSVAAGARVFGARAVIYLSETVPEPFALRLTGMGADVVRAGADYSASMDAAAKAAFNNNWTLLSDSSWPGYTEPALRVMEGYTQMAAEIVTQIDAVPTHILLQAGVGGLAAAVAAHLRMAWGQSPQIIVSEPAAAPALIESIRAGRVVDTTGPDSCMGRLDCKTPSMIALNGLARDADLFVTIGEEDARTAADTLTDLGLGTTPSGAGGIAALFAGLTLPADARVLAILSEGPESA